MSKQDSLSLWKQRIEEQKTVVWESGNGVNPNSFPKIPTTIGERKYKEYSLPVPIGYLL